MISRDDDYEIVVARNLSVVAVEAAESSVCQSNPMWQVITVKSKLCCSNPNEPASLPARVSIWPVLLEYCCAYGQQYTSSSTPVRSIYLTVVLR